MSTITKSNQADKGKRVLGRKIGRELSADEISTVSGAGTNWTAGPAPSGSGEHDTDFED